MTKKELTKKDFLDWLGKSTLKHDSKKSYLYKKYFPLFKATLSFCPNGHELTPASSLSDWSKVDDFENFIRDSSEGEIEDRFKAVLTDLNTLAEDYISKNPQRVRNSVSALAYCNDTMMKKRKRNKVWFFIFISLFIALSTVTAVFALLDNFKIVDFGDKIAGFCGICDFIVGVGSVFYEIFDDRRKDKIGTNTEDATSDGDITKLIPSYPQIIYVPHAQVEDSENVHIDQRPDSHDVINIIVQVLTENGDVTKALQQLSHIPLAQNALATKQALDSIRCDETVLKKADEWTDRLVEYGCTTTNTSDAGNQIRKLRLQIYCDALRNEYSDIYLNRRRRFSGAKGYGDKFVAACEETQRNVVAQNLRSLETCIVDCLLPDLSSAQQAADSLLEEFQNRLHCHHARFEAALQEYVDAIRNEYTDICLNKKKGFSGAQKVKEALLTAARTFSVDLRGDDLKKLEEEISLVLRPNFDTVSAKADQILDDFMRSVA